MGVLWIRSGKLFPATLTLTSDAMILFGGRTRVPLKGADLTPVQCKGNRVGQNGAFCPLNP